MSKVNDAVKTATEIGQSVGELAKTLVNLFGKGGNQSSQEAQISQAAQQNGLSTEQVLMLINAYRQEKQNQPSWLEKNATTLTVLGVGIGVVQLLLMARKGGK